MAEVGVAIAREGTGALMGYFPNGSAGEAYEAEWCNRCVHQMGCGVWFAHLSFAYGATPEQAKVLDTLIPRQGTRNLKCAMFVSLEDVKRRRTVAKEQGRLF